MASARYMAAFSWFGFLATLVCCHTLQSAPSTVSQEHAEIKGVLQTILQTLQDRRSETGVTQLEAIQARMSALEARVSADERKIRTVAFAATITEQNLPAAPGHVIPFRTVVTNVGNAYDNTTSSFTAPGDGQYMFLVSVDTSTKYARLSINKNGRAIFPGHNDSGQSSHITTGGVVTLKAGDKVTVHHGTGKMEGFVDGGPEAIFTGFKI